MALRRPARRQACSEMLLAWDLPRRSQGEQAARPQESARPQSIPRSQRKCHPHSNRLAQMASAGGVQTVQFLERRKGERNPVLRACLVCVIHTT